MAFFQIPLTNSDTVAAQFLFVIVEGTDMADACERAAACLPSGIGKIDEAEHMDAIPEADLMDCPWPIFTDAYFGRCYAESSFGHSKF